MSEFLGTSGPPLGAKPPVVYFDGLSNRRRQVELVFGAELDIMEDGKPAAHWAYADIRRSDSPDGLLRLSCKSALSLSRLEVRDAGLAGELERRCTQLDEHRANRRGIARIVGWSVAAAVSIVGVVLFGVPLAADRLAPLVPASIENRVGDAAEMQVEAVFGKRFCDDPAGQAAFTKLVTRLREVAGLDSSVRSAVLSTPVANAFALPGGKVYLMSGLLDKAYNVDEIAGVLAHELGHLKHHDNMRTLIYNGGTSYLIGLLFGDVTGSAAVIFASRSLVEASYSREAETAADTFAIETMRELGRSPVPAAELMLRVTGVQGGGSWSLLASHPLTEDRLDRMAHEDRPVTGPPLLTNQEWGALKGICGKTGL